MRLSTAIGSLVLVSNSASALTATPKGAVSAVGVLTLDPSFCTATLIGSRTIVTAKHCVVGNDPKAYPLLP